MSAWTDIIVPLIDDPDRTGADDIPAVFGSIKSFRDQIATVFADGDAPVAWTPRLVVNDANAGNSWTPTTGTNPTLGTGSIAKGRTFRVGKTCWAEGVIYFGTAGVNAGSGAYRLSLPHACTADANTYQKICGYGHMYDDDAPGTFLGLGPANFKHFMLHNAPSVTTDVVGLVLGTNLRSSALSSSGYTLTNHTNVRALVENVGDGTALDSNIGATTISVAGGVTRVHANSGAGHQVWAFDDAYVGKRIFASDGTNSAYGVIAAVNNAGTSAGGLGELDLTTNLGLSAVANGSFIVYAENARTDVSHALGTVINDLKAALGANILDNTSDANPWVWGANDRIIFTMLYETP